MFTTDCGRPESALLDGAKTVMSDVESMLFMRACSCSRNELSMERVAF